MNIHHNAKMRAFMFEVIEVIFPSLRRILGVHYVSMLVKSL